MKPSDLLVEALREVDEAGITGELRATAFAKAVDLVAANHMQATASTKAGSGVAETQDPKATHSPDPLDRIVSRLAIGRDTASQIYYVDDEEVEIIVGQGKLAKKSGTATKQLALLVVAGRQAVGVDKDWTSVDRIRRWCEHYKRLDAPNFAAQIKGMSDLFSFRGSPMKRELRMTKPAWERATELIKELAG